MKNLKTELSVALITSKEESNITKCLESVIEIADEISLVHNDCVDNTVEIAREYTVKCVEGKEVA